MKIVGKRYWMWFSVWILTLFGWSGNTQKAHAHGSESTALSSPEGPQLAKDKDHKVTSHKVPTLNESGIHKGAGHKSHTKLNAGVKTKSESIQGSEIPTESIGKADTPGGVGGHKLNSKVRSQTHKIPSPRTPQ
jgi:hypothetical protein